MSVLQEQYPARTWGVRGQYQTKANGNMIKTFNYPNETAYFTLKFGLPRLPASVTSVQLNGFAINYVINSGSITSAVVTLTKYIDTNGQTETATTVPLNSSSPAYNLVSGTTMNRPYSAVTTPTVDSEASNTTVNYLITLTIVAVSTCTIEFSSADVFFIPASSSTGSSTATIGSLVAGNVETASLVKADGRILSQATYPDLYARVGITPQFNSTIRTFLPANCIDVAYGVINSIGTYIAVGNSQMFISTDVVTWDRIIVSHNVQSITSIAFLASNSTFIACINSTTTLYSTDAINWYTALCSDFAVSWVATSPTLAVAVGTNSTDNAIQYVYRSSDGITWTKTSIANNGLIPTAISYCPAFGAGTAIFVLGTSSGAIQTSPDGITWTARTSNVVGNINAIAIGAVGANGTIVAVGTNGVITVSTDSGVTWTAATYQTSNSLTGVAYSPTNNNWLAIGSQVVMSTTNATTWQTISALINGPTYTFYGNGLYVDCGTTGLLATSPDLVTWTPRRSADPTITFNSGAYGAGVYVIVGQTSTTGRLQSSSDAITWTSRTSNAGNNNIVNVIYVAGTINLFIAIANSGTIITSPDGTTWTARTSNLTAVNAGQLAFNGTIVVAVAASGKISTSTDGTTWTARTSNTTATLSNVAHNGTIFCAVGFSPAVIITSPDGITWTRIDAAIGTAVFNSIAARGSTFYADASSYLFHSTDAITWTRYPTWWQSGFTYNVNNILIRSDNFGRKITSTDGIAWTAPSVARCIVSNPPGKCYWSSVHSKYLLTQSGSGIATSIDGVAFSGVKSNVLKSIVYSASQTKLVATSSVGGICVSTDNGITFNIVNVLSEGNTPHSFPSIAYSPTLDQFVVVSSFGSIFTSTNATTWTQQQYTHPSFGQNSVFTTVIWATIPAIFVAIGGCVIATSSNGTTWATRTSNINTNANILDLKYNTALNKFVACGNNCDIITSTDAITWTHIQLPAGGLPTMILSTVISNEADGFMILANGQGYMLVSPDGITWSLRTIPQEAIVAGNAKSFYSAVDNCSFFFNDSTSPTNIQCNLLMANSQGISVVQPIYNTARFTSITYIPSIDTYVGVGDNSTVCRFTRTYNKATQFVIPNIPNTLVQIS